MRAWQEHERNFAVAERSITAQCQEIERNLVGRTEYEPATDERNYHYYSLKHPLPHIPEKQSELRDIFQRAGLTPLLGRSHIFMSLYAPLEAESFERLQRQLAVFQRSLRTTPALPTSMPSGGTGPRRVVAAPQTPEPESAIAAPALHTPRIVFSNGMIYAPESHRIVPVIGKFLPENRVFATFTCTAALFARAGFDHDEAACEHFKAIAARGQIVSPTAATGIIVMKPGDPLRRPYRVAGVLCQPTHKLKALGDEHGNECVLGRCIAKGPDGETLLGFEFPVADAH